MSEEDKEKEKTPEEGKETEEAKENNTQDAEKDSKENKDENSSNEKEKDDDRTGEKMANEEKNEKHKHEEHESAKHSRIKEKLHIMKHHAARNCWKCTSIALIVLILAFSALSLFGVFSIKYNGFSAGKGPGVVSTKGLTMIVLSDKRCGADCDTTSLLTQLKTIFPEATVQEIDYSTKEGKALFESTKVQYLPAVLFNNDVNKSASFAQVQQYLVAAGTYQSLRIGAAFDPTKEICSNKIDDNGDGKIDCLDPECTASFECREEKKANLMLFIMSDCPYGRKAIEALKEVYTTFNKSFTYEVHYIATESGTGFTSLHGQYEVDENIVQLCVDKYSPDKWLDYVYCRSVNGVKGIDWKTCAAETKIDTAKVDACAKGEEGKTLLREDIKIANAMGIGASPSWIANNRYQFGGIDAATVQTQFCQYNAGLAGCSATVSNTTSVPAGSCA
jgi:hypothetical protein